LDSSTFQSLHSIDQCVTLPVASQRDTQACTAHGRSSLALGFNGNEERITHRMTLQVSGPVRSSVTPNARRIQQAATMASIALRRGLGGQLGTGPRPLGVEHESTTAPHTAVPAMASGTFNPLCKVLCILQSLYLCTIGPTVVLRLGRDTPPVSNCSPKQLYSWIQPATPWYDHSTRQEYGTVSLCRGPIPGHPSWCQWPTEACRPLQMSPHSCDRSSDSRPLENHTAA